VHHDADVKCIENGRPADEDTVKRMPGTWWSVQLSLDDADANPRPDPVQRAKPIGVSRGSERAFEFDLGHKPPMSFGTDARFRAAKVPRGGRLGIIAAAALGHLLVVDGDPAACRDRQEDHDDSLRLIRKGGSIPSLLEQIP
jgi:hypothetical protein